MINAQERGSWSALPDYYKGTATIDDVILNSFKANLTDDSKFFLPFPDNDITMNPNLLADPVPFDFSTIGY